jgi:hypothetical protein
MSSNRRLRASWLSALLATGIPLLMVVQPWYAAAADPRLAGPAGPGQPAQATPSPVLTGRIDLARRLAPQALNEHPLAPAVRWAAEGLPGLEAVHDYSATVVKRERIGNKIGEHEYMFTKIRHHPFSVYMYFLGPPDLKGQEVVFVQGKNNGNMWAHGTGMQEKLFGTVSLKPDGMIAMRGQRYPLTEIGLLNMVRRLVEVGKQDMQYGECEVKYFQGAKINDRTCTCIQVVHPVPRRNFLFHLARIFVDEELNLPLRYESYDWPKEKGGQPQLLEEYTYLNLKLNNGFTDEDFDTHNPNYRFR